jgi:hypothetical protein
VVWARLHRPCSREGRECRQSPAGHLTEERPEPPLRLAEALAGLQEPVARAEQVPGPAVVTPLASRCGTAALPDSALALAADSIRRSVGTAHQVEAVGRFWSALHRPLTRMTVVTHETFALTD